MTECPELRAYKRKTTLPAIFCVLAVLVASVAPPIDGQNPPEIQKSSPLERHLVILLDINPNQTKVFGVELSLAEGVIQKLKLSANTFSVITFGCLPPVLLKSDVGAGEAISALQQVEIERRATDNISNSLRGGLKLAFDQFTDGRRSKSILIISEGNDYFPGKTFKQTLLRAQQLQVAFHVAMAANHTFYGTKGIQHYGFDLRRLAGKTHGRYIEVGSRQKKVAAAADRLSESILSQIPAQ